MSQQVPSAIRVKVRAAVVAQNQVLVVEYGDGWEPHFNLPGGRVEPNESLIDALKPEVHEETCAAIDLERLVLVCEFNTRHPTYEPGMTPVLELIFACSVVDPRSAQLPAHPDPHQVAVRWIPLMDLGIVPLRPNIGEQLRGLLPHVPPIPTFTENPPMR